MRSIVTDPNGTVARGTDCAWVCRCCSTKGKAAINVIYNLGKSGGALMQQFEGYGLKCMSIGFGSLTASNRLPWCHPQDRQFQFHVGSTGRHDA